MRLLILISLTFLFVLTPAISLAHQVNNQVLVEMTDDGFNPKKITVIQGTVINFKNSGEKARWPASNIHPTHRAYPNTDIELCETDAQKHAFDACRGVRAGEVYSFQFDKPGKWYYHDHLNPEDGGNIEVTADEHNEAPISETTTPQKRGLFSRIGAWFGKLARGIASIFSSDNKNEQDQKLAQNDDEAEDTKEKTDGRQASTADQSEDDSPSEAMVLDVIRSEFRQDSKEIATVVSQEQSDTDKHAGDQIPQDSTKIFHDTTALHSYIEKYSPSQALASLQRMESSYGNCHDPAHDVGRLSYNIHGVQAFRLCSSECQSGCYHGAVEAYFNEHGTQNIGESLGQLCTEDLSAWVSHQCLHGVGHGLMAWSNYELPDALSGCDELPTGEVSCYGGVFMENIVQSMAEFLETDGHVTKYLKDDDPHYPCSILEEKYKPHCYFLQTDHMMTIFNGDVAKVANTCSEVESDYARRLCLESMGRTVGSRNRHNPGGAIAECGLTQAGETRDSCLRGSIQDTFWNSQDRIYALSYCLILEDSADKHLCYNTISMRAGELLLTIDERSAFCTQVEENYRTQCKTILGV